MSRKNILIILILSLPVSLSGIVFVWLGVMDLFLFTAIFIINIVGLCYFLLFPLSQIDELVKYLQHYSGLSDGGAPDLDAFFDNGSLRLALNNNRQIISDYYNLATRINKELEVLLDMLPMPIIQINLDRRVMRQNISANLLLGGQALGKDLVMVLRLPAVIEAVDSVIRTAESVNIEVSVGSTDVQRFLCYITAPVGEKSNEAIIIVFNDISDVVKGQKMRIDFITNASHEIRTPLATLAGCIETLEGPARGNLVAEEKFLGVARNEIDRMIVMVNGLLSLSALESSQQGKPSDIVDIQVGIRRVVQNLYNKTTLETTNAAIKFHEREEPLNVIGNENELEQLWTNLLSNALRYGNGQVDIRIKKLDSPSGSKHNINYLKIDFIDNGSGIEERYIPRLTERFYRIDPARSRDLGGTGLGLAIVKHIVAGHSGRLEIRSQIGTGSTFSVFLPVA